MAKYTENLNGLFWLSLHVKCIELHSETLKTATNSVRTRLGRHYVMISLTILNPHFNPNHIQ